jgi:hypothetical protein
MFALSGLFNLKREKDIMTKNNEQISSDMHDTICPCWRGFAIRAMQMPDLVRNFQFYSARITNPRQR